MKKWLIIKTFRLYLKIDRRLASKMTPIEFILIVAVTAAITVKFKSQIEEKLFSDNSQIYRYYDYVEPQIKPRIPDYLKE